MSIFETASEPEKPGKRAASHRQKPRGVQRAIAALCCSTLMACAGVPQVTDRAGVKPVFSYAVTNNDTPYSQCLTQLAGISATNLPKVSVGEVADKTGKINYEEDGHAISQGISEMTISALAKTGKVKLLERLDLRIPLAEMKLAEQEKLERSVDGYGKLPASDFIVVGALTELNHNIVSGGAKLVVQGIGGGARTVIVNVALDLRVIDAKDFSVRYVASLQKQIYGYEVEAHVFRFFGNTLIEFDAGQVQNEPLQLGVRSVVEMAVYQIMTDFLGLEKTKSCRLVETGHLADHLEQLAPEDNGEE